MEVFWFLIIAVILAVFFILDGYDFGAGIIHLFYAKKEEDKVLVAKSAGLFWDANEVWFVVAGALLFMVFPTYYAAVFSGFYLPLMIILWLMIFRAIGLEFRGQFNYQMWKDLWDKAFGVSSLLLAFFFGVGLGNVVRGVNLGGVENGVSLYESHYFFLPLWNAEFSPLTDHPGIFDYFTIIIGVISVLTLAIHGANWIIYKTNSGINDKLKSVIFVMNIILTIGSIISLNFWNNLNDDFFNNFLEKPYLLIFPVLYFIGIIGTFFIRKFKKNYYGFIFSTLTILGGITSTLASLFPIILPSRNKVNPDLTIYNMAVEGEGLSMALGWGITGIILMGVYLVVRLRLTKGKIDEMDYGH